VQASGTLNAHRSTQIGEDHVRTPHPAQGSSAHGSVQGGHWLAPDRGALAAVTIGLLASAATIPAAFASEVPQPGSGYQLGRFGPVPATTSRAAATGVPGWQIILITVGAVLVAAALTIVLARARPSHRAIPSPAA
jgi:hypothetical protein